jgi:hypothetical protein
MAYLLGSVGAICCTPDLKRRFSSLDEHGYTTWRGFLSDAPLVFVAQLIGGSSLQDSTVLLESFAY